MNEIIAWMIYGKFQYHNSCVCCVCVNDGNDYTHAIIIATFFSLSLFCYVCASFSPYIAPTVAGLTMHAITNFNWLVKFGITRFNAIKIQMNKIQLNLNHPTNRYSDVVYGVHFYHFVSLCIQFVSLANVGVIVVVNRSEWVYRVSRYYRIN